MTLEQREQARLIADGLLLDATLSYVAMMRARGLEHDARVDLAEVWADALAESSSHARDVSDNGWGDQRAGFAHIYGTQSWADESVEARVEAEIQQRAAKFLAEYGADTSPSVLSPPEEIVRAVRDLRA